MARLPRVVAPGYPHHIVQRGNRRLPTFFKAEDYWLYLRLMSQWCEAFLMSQWCEAFQVEIWAYCLMTNHVHLIAVPSSEEGLRKAIGEAHRRYTTAVNKRERWTGHLWQGRFSSVVMDEAHLLTAARYVELNPVKAGMVQSADEYKWSSARAHMNGCDDLLVKVRPMLGIVGDWGKYLAEPEQTETYDDFIKNETTGRPLGSPSFVEELEALLGRSLKPQKRGRKKKSNQ